EARAMIHERGTLRAPHRMYFETGQGSELSAGAHGGADQVTLEARCYGLARRYDPFLVNTVVGFIGPEYLADGRQIVRAGLEDHFMGKLLGVPLGADACYTNHADADQNDCDTLATMLATPGAAGHPSRRHSGPARDRSHRAAPTRSGLSRAGRRSCSRPRRDHQRGPGSVRQEARPHRDLDPSAHTRGVRAPTRPRPYPR